MSPAPNTSPRPQLFHCPTCGASLPVPDAATVKCQYCGSSVIVPPEYRPTPKPPEPSPRLEPVVIQMSSQPLEIERSARRSIGAIIAIIVFLFVLGTLVTVGLALAGVFATSAVISSSFDVISTQSIAINIPASPTLAPSEAPTATPIPLAAVALNFGGKGSGPGQFDDARSIAVDTEETIFVAEYLDGRIQKFDSTGKFLQLITTEPDSVGNNYIKDIAVDYQGRLLVVRASDILIFNAKDGAQTGSIPGNFPNTIYSALAFDLSNHIYTLHDSASGTDLIKLDPTGKNLWRKPNFMAEIKDRQPFTFGGLTVDGLGNAYVLSSNGGQVYKFDAEGQFVDRFGSKGDGPGQLNSPQGIAIDPKGRIFINDFDEILVFSPDSSYLQSIPRFRDFSTIRDITFDAQGNFYFVTVNGEVVKAKLSF